MSIFIFYLSGRVSSTCCLNSSVIYPESSGITTVFPVIGNVILYQEISLNSFCLTHLSPWRWTLVPLNTQSRYVCRHSSAPLRSLDAHCGPRGRG